MHKKVVLGALAAALMTLALVPFAAGAAPAAVTISADASVARYPSAVTFYASVPDTSTLTTTTAIFQTRSVTSTWTTAAVVVSGTGRWAWVSAPNKAKMFVRALIEGVYSAELPLLVRVPMGKPTLSARHIHPGGAMTFAGTIRPSHVGGNPLSIQLQKWDAKKKKWRAARQVDDVHATAYIDNDTGLWTLTVTHNKADIGSWRVRSFHECDNHAASYSTWATYKVIK